MILFNQSSMKNYLNSTQTMTATTRIDFKGMVEENAVVVFARKGCCISHAVRHLLHAAGANPAVYEMEENDVAYVARELQKADTAAGGSQGGLKFPEVFIGGRWFGGLDQIIIAHIAEELTPLLKQGGALWL